MVLIFDDLAYSASCGRTGHHYKDGLAFKFEDETYETVLQSIEWTPSRFGELAPVAVFDTVEIDGCSVSRATLHNLTFIRELELVPDAVSWFPNGHMNHSSYSRRTWTVANTRMQHPLSVRAAVLPQKFIGKLQKKDGSLRPYTAAIHPVKASS